MERPIVFLSDFGYRNEWVGICHAVMNRIAPASPIVDLSHGVPPLDETLQFQPAAEPGLGEATPRDTTPPS